MQRRTMKLAGLMILASSSIGKSLPRSNQYVTVPSTATVVRHSMGLSSN